MKTTFGTIVGILFSTGLASAQIGVTGTQTAVFGDDTAGTFSIPYQVQNPNSVLVFGTYIDAGGSASTGISFGTGAGDQATDGLITLDRSTLSYFLNPSTSAGLSINLTAGTGSKAYFLWELSGVDPAGSVQSSTGADGATQITTVAGNSFITDFFGVNDFGITGGLDGIAPDANSVLSKVNGSFAVPGGGWAVGGQATAGAAGTYELGWEVTGGFGNYGELAYAFTPVPEPTSAALIGLGILGLVAYRRDRRT